jgi:hypothetical protein
MVFLWKKIYIEPVNTDDLLIHCHCGISEKKEDDSNFSCFLFRNVLSSPNSLNSQVIHESRYTLNPLIMVTGNKGLGIVVGQVVS